MNLLLNPEFIMTDFELAPINAWSLYYPNAKQKGYILYLAKLFYHKILDVGLRVQYGQNRDL
jgi:hypothetical protein